MSAIPIGTIFPTSTQSGGVSLNIPATVICLCGTPLRTQADYWGCRHCGRAFCRECGGPLARSGGCDVCTVCGSGVCG